MITYDLEETLLAAFMCNKPVVLVEGQDDIKFYDSIISLESFNAEVLAIETIDGYSEGCEQVLKAIDDALILFRKDRRLTKFLIGIIDRDSRQYVNRLPQKENLLVLRYYSYETHLITDYAIKKIIEVLTHNSLEAVTPEVLAWLRKDFEEQNESLYYFALEALKKMTDSTYQAYIEYDFEGGALTRKGKEHYWELIAPKTQELDKFATEHHITKTDIKCIAKGKWYLETWCEYLIKMQNELYKLCGKRIPICKYCQVGQKNKCMWRKSCTYQITEIKNLLLSRSFIDLNEVSYIVDYIKEKLVC